MTSRKTIAVLMLGAAALVAVSTALPVAAQDGRMPMPPGGPMEMRDGLSGMALFEAIDTDGNGTVTAEEILAWRKSSVLGVDSNSDGKLSADELAAREITRLTERANARAARMVKDLDVDGDGLISVEEMAARPMPMTMMIERIDTNGDGAITRAEAEAFAARMTEAHGRRGDGPKGDRGPGRTGGRGGWGDGGHGHGHGGAHGRPMGGDAPPPPPPPPADGEAAPPADNG